MYTLRAWENVFWGFFCFFALVLIIPISVVLSCIKIVLCLQNLKVVWEGEEEGGG